jgi:tetratricopeptide (TPR) repeat protein
MPRAPLPGPEPREAPSAIPATSPSHPHAANVASALATPLPPPIGQLGGTQPELDRPRQVPAVERETAPAHELAEPQLTPTPSGVSEAYRAYQESYPDARFASAGPSPVRSRARWAVGVVVIGLIVFVGAVFARRYLTRVASEQKQEQPMVARDERVVAMLKQGNAALNEGDFEGAKEQFDKASVLADKDPEVLAALARLEATRADVHWLALRLVDAADSTASSNERAELGKRLERAKKAAADAAQVASDDPSVRRAHVDALRLEGKLAEARQLVAQMRPDPSDPETAYVLAALDLADTLPVWSTIVDRLRTAAGVEGGIGRARAALVYALASSGAAEEAAQELTKLETAKHPHPLASRLRAFVERMKVAAADPSAAAVASGSMPAAGEARGAEALPGGDFRKLLEDASAARQRGDLARAETLYRAARDKNPGNIEALAGLADVARMRGDTENARKLHEGVLAANPSYVPSLVALADMKWGAGDRAGAAALYKRVLAQTGPGSVYGQRASARIAEHEGAGSKAAAGAPSPAPPAEQPSPQPQPQPPAESPHIDTTDLPGFQQ